MSDLHQMPLMGRDLPSYRDWTHTRPRVWSHREATGHRLWFWRVTDKVTHMSSVHGPFWTCADAHNDIGRELR